MAMNFLFCCMLVVSVLSKEERVAQLTPVEYTTVRPFNIAPDESKWFYFSTCESSVSVPLHITAQIIFPNSPWKIPAGSFVEFAVYAAEDCTKPVCTNDLQASDPSVCAFTHSSRAQSNYFLHVRSPIFGLAGQLATVSIRSVPAVPPFPVPSVNKSLNNTHCPIDPQKLRVAFRAESALVVENSPYDTNKWVQFELPVCGSHFENGFTYSSSTTDTSSATSSFLCKDYPCLAINSFDRDLSGSALNRIVVAEPIKASTFLSVAGYGVFGGWGQYSGFSRFIFSVVPN